MRFIAWIGLVLAVMLGSSSAFARDWIDQVSILLDQEGNLSLDTVRERPDWRPAGAYVSLGFTRSTLWIRVDRAPNALPIPMRLRMRPAYLDRVDVFTPVEDGRWVLQSFGDRQPRGGNLVRESAFSAEVDGAQTGPIYIRVVTSSTMAVQLELVDEADAYWAAAFEHLLFGVYFGLMGFLTLWAFISAWSRGDRSLALFGVYLCMLLGLGLGITGLAGAMLLTDRGSDGWTTAFVLSSTLSASLFHRFFLARLEPPTWILRILDLCLAASLVNLAVWLAIGPELALKSNAWLVILGCLAVSLAAMLPRARKTSADQTVFVAYALMLVALGITMLPILGLDFGGLLGIHLTMSHGLIVSIIITLMLGRLGRLEMLERQRLTLAEEQARRELGIKTAQNHEYDQLLAMLTHELRNALSTAALVVTRLQRGEFRGLTAGVRGRDERTDSEPGAQVDPEFNRSLRRAAAALRSASSVLDKVQVARQLEGPLPLKPVIAQLEERIDSILDRLSVDDVMVEIDPSMALVQDWTYLELIVANLLENADRYRSKGTVIRVRAQLVRHKMVDLTVQNRMARPLESDPERMFEKYWRDDRARAQQGAGLGLWLARHAAHALGGRLTCRVIGPEIEFCLTVPEIASRDAADLPVQGDPG
jgi:signal transduction histidine kinase